MLYGHDYHNSFEKHQLNAELLKTFAPSAALLVLQANTILEADNGPKLLFNQPRFGKDGKHTDTWKLQYLDKSDYESPEEALQARRSISPAVKLIQDLAFDELCQLFQVSRDPKDPSTTSVVAIRTIMDSDRQQMRKAIGRKRQDEWDEIVSIMGHGVFSMYGSFSREAREQSKKTVEHTTDHWMERFTFDKTQFEYGCRNLDLLILNCTLALGGLRAYMYMHNGQIPEEANKLLRDLGIRQ